MIICLGTTPAVQRTLTFEHLTIDSVNRAATTHQHAAGKAINAARVLHTLGKEVLATGFLGGFSGDFIREDLDLAHIPHDFVTVEPETRTCVTVLENTDKTATELLEEAAPLPLDAYDALLQKLQSLLKNAAGLILSGNLQAGASVDFYAKCAAAAKGKIILIDAKGDALQAAIAEHPTVIKPNRGELELTMGKKIGSEDALKSAVKKLIEAGASSVIVTAGAADTIASDGSSFWRISTPSVPTVNAIGSGDSFGAGVMSALCDGQKIPDACRLGAACGAANAMTQLAAHIRREDVQQLLPQIAVTEF